MPRKSFVIIEVGNIEVTLYWLTPRMDFSHVHVPEAQKVLNRWNFNSFWILHSSVAFKYASKILD